MKRKMIYRMCIFSTMVLLAVALCFFIQDSRKKRSFHPDKAQKSGEEEIAKVKEGDLKEVRAVWIYFDEMNKKASDFSTWEKYIDKTFQTCVKKGYNTVILQVRPFADAMYDSQYFPWSAYATGTMGKDPGFDPLEYAVEAAHKRNLKIQAWVNPYRITAAGIGLDTLPKDSIARVWYESSDKTKKRNVLSVNGAWYFNPSSIEVQELVAKGVEEIVSGYAVDGIHMDDYFYPSLGNESYKKFDYKEYELYQKQCRKEKKESLGLVDWRRENVNKMVKKVYHTIKEARKDCLFGISPAGNLANLYSETAYYSPVKTWMKEEGYIDYICPQIYWSFTQKTAPYKKMVDEWCSLERSKTVKLYIGLAGYRAGISKKEAKAVCDTGWAESSTILKRQVLYGRKTGEVEGYFVFSYQSLERKSASEEMKHLSELWKEEEGNK